MFSESIILFPGGFPLLGEARPHVYATVTFWMLHAQTHPCTYTE